MNFVNIHRQFVGIALFSFFKIISVRPFVPFQFVNLGRRGGSGLAVRGVRVGFESDGVVCALYGIFVVVESLDTFDVTLPYPAVAQSFHGVFFPVPVVEIPDDGNAQSIGRPYSETPHPFFVLLYVGYRKKFIGFEIRAFVKQIHGIIISVFCHIRSLKGNYLVFFPHRIFQ